MELKLKNNKGLVEYCKKQLGKPYWYGTFGQISNPSLLANKKRQYPAYYTASDFGKQMGVKVHDCIGLIKGYMWCKDAEDTKPTYCSNNYPDRSADKQYADSKRKGDRISTLPEVEGVLVFMRGHVGVYIGGGYVIEARGHAYGVVKTKLERRPWKRWAYIDEIQYL
jgi:cell wall-associated NlpC family hydrolase